MSSNIPGIEQSPFYTLNKFITPGNIENKALCSYSNQPKH